MSNIFENNYNIYKKYHNNIYNIYIHKVTIPLIILSSFLLLNKIKIKNISINIFLLSFYCIYYFYINFEIAIYANLFYILLYITSNKLYKIKNIYKISILIFSFSWFIQLSGHFILENNKPALMDNFKQSLLMAPLFIFI